MKDAIIMVGMIVALFPVKTDTTAFLIIRSMDWYEEEVQQLTEQRDALSYTPQTIFYGSSSIRLWKNLYEDFEAFLPVNLGFGGSTLEACVYFFDRIVSPVSGAQKLIVYAGDNDLGDGKSPDEVVGYFTQLRVLIHHQFPSIACYYISIKPSISRWHINDNIISVNKTIRNEIERTSNNMAFINVYDSMLQDNYPLAQYYDEDGLHLSPDGYKLWKEILLKEVFGKKRI